MSNIYPPNITQQLFDATPAEPDVKRIERQLRHIEAAMLDETDEKKLDFLCGSFQALNWARSPNAFVPPVQMRDSL